METLNYQNQVPLTYWFQLSVYILLYSIYYNQASQLVGRNPFKIDPLTIFQVLDKTICLKSRSYDFYCFHCYFYYYYHYHYYYYYYYYLPFFLIIIIITTISYCYYRFPTNILPHRPIPRGYCISYVPVHPPSIHTPPPSTMDQNNKLFTGQQKNAPYHFSPVTSTNIGLSSKNFLTFSFDPFVILM